MTQLLEFRASQLGRAADSIELGNTLNGVKVHLTKAPVTIDPTTVIATLDAVECDYTGYAATAIVWGVPGVADDGAVEVTSTAQLYRPTDAVTPNVAWAIYITDSTDALLYFAAQFDDAPFPMGTALDQIIVIVRFRPADDSIVVTVT